MLLTSKLFEGRWGARAGLVDVVRLETETESADEIARPRVLQAGEYRRVDNIVRRLQRVFKTAVSKRVVRDYKELFSEFDTCVWDGRDVLLRVC